MRTLCTTLLSGISGACTIIPVRHERSVAKSKDALFVLAILLMIAALAGCGGGGGKTAALPTPVAIDLPQGTEGIMLEPGAALTIPAGEKRTVHEANGMRTEFTCPADGPDCVVSLTEDGAPQSTGGTPTVATYTAIEGLPSDHDLMAGTIPAGEFRTVHRTFDTRTVVTCPAGGEDCEVTLTDNGAESTGGALTVTTYTTLYLPSDLLLSDPTLTGGTTIPAGESRPIGYSRGRSHVLVCPFDGEACVVTLGEYGDFESTGGAPYVVSTITNRMVWIANNGPDGTSDGAYARSFEGRLLSSGALNDLFTADPERQGANVQSTLATEASVTPTASWASSATAPTLGLDVAGFVSTSVDQDSEVPSLGEGWNGAALIESFANWTLRAVIYSNIAKQPDGQMGGRILPEHLRRNSRLRCRDVQRLHRCREQRCPAHRRRVRNRDTTMKERLTHAAFPREGRPSTSLRYAQDEREDSVRYAQDERRVFALLRFLRLRYAQDERGGLFRGSLRRSPRPPACPPRACPGTR